MPKLDFPLLKFLRLNTNLIIDISELSKSILPELQILELEINQVEIIP